MNASDEQIFQFVEMRCLEYSAFFCEGRLWKVRQTKSNTTDYGSCSKRGLVRIRIRWGKRNRGKLLTAWEILDTVAHELAHLVYLKHSNCWFVLYATILKALAADGQFGKLKELLK